MCSLAVITGVIALSQASAASAATQTVAQGKITDSSGNPVAGESVECRLQNGSLSSTVVSDATGSYTCQLDTATFVVNQTTYGVEIRNLSEGYSYTGQVLVTWTGSAATVNFELISAAKTLHVNVYNEKDELVQAVVTVQPVSVANPDDKVQVMEEAPTGQATITVPGGRYVVVAGATLTGDNADQYPWLTVGKGTEVTFAENSTSEEQTIDLHVISASTKVRVKMVDKDGNVLNQNNFNGDYGFTGYSGDYGFISTTRKIDSDGAVEVYLLPGVWSVNAYHASQLKGQSYDPDETSFVLSESSSTVDWGTITAVENKGTLSGTVDLLNSNSVSGLMVVATHLETGERFITETESGGSFSIEDVAAGKYSVTFGDDDSIPVSTALAEITSDETTAKGLELTAYLADMEISGTVEDTAGNALTDFPGTVSIKTDTAEFSAPVESDGTYTLKVATQALDSKSAELELVTLPGADAFALEPVTVNLKSESTVVADIETSDEEASISGSLLTQDKDAVTSDQLGDGAEVMALNMATGAVEIATVDADGSYGLAVGPGEWSVVPRLADADASVLASSASKAIVTVKAEETESMNLTVREQTATLEGIVKDTGGDVVAEVPVIISNLPALEAAANATGQNVDESKIVSVVTTTDDTGQFSQDLPPGDYTVTYGSNPDVQNLVEPAAATVVLKDGATKDITAEFQKANATVSGELGKNIEGGSVTAYSDAGGSETMLVADDGSFSGELAPGEWTIIATGVKDETVYLDQSTVTITSGDNTITPELEATAIALPATVTVSGDASEPITVANTAGASVTIPAYSAAFEGDVTATLQPVLEFGNNGSTQQVSLSYEVSVLNSDGVAVKQLNRDATVVLPLDETLANGVAADEITSAYYDSNLQSFLTDGIVSETNADSIVMYTSHFSRFAATSTGINDVPSVPRALKVKKISTNQATFTWKRPQNGAVQSFIVQWSLGSSKNSFGKVEQVKVTASGNATTFKKQIKQLQSGSTYRWRVRAENDFGTSAWPKWQGFTTR